MNLWRRVKTELAGAWRSLRYDLGRRPAFPESRPGPDRGPDVTCTGMSTFGGPVEDGGPLGEAYAGYDEFGRPPRPLAAVSAFLLLAVIGAAASYFAVVNGLGSLLREKPAVPRSYPLAAGAPPAGHDAATSGLGRAGGGRARAATGPSAPATTTAAGTPVIGSAGANPATRPGGSAAYRTVPPRRTPPERGMTPPVPTPTAPSPDPSAGPSPSPSGSLSPSGSPSASPSDPPAPEPPASGPSGEAGANAAGASNEALLRHRRTGY